MIPRRWFWRRRLALGDYAANAGEQYDIGMVNGESGSQQFGQYDGKKSGPIFSNSRIAVRHVSDGLSNTIAIGERHIPPVPAGTAANMGHYVARGHGIHLRR